MTSIDAGTPYGNNAEHAGRAIVDARSHGGRCEICGRLGQGVHHRAKRGQGGSWSASNLLRLCGSGTTGCHGWVERNPSAAMLLGLWLPAHAEPAAHPAFCHPISWSLGWWLLCPDGTIEAAYLDDDPYDARPEVGASRELLVGHIATRHTIGGPL